MPRGVHQRYWAIEWQPRSLDVGGNAEATHLSGMKYSTFYKLLPPCGGGVCEIASQSIYWDYDSTNGVGEIILTYPLIFI